MLKSFYMFMPILNYYGSVDKNNTQANGLLYLLFLSFSPMNDFIIVDCEEDNPNIITIQIRFPSDTKNEYGPDAILKMSLDNYHYIAQQWDKVIESKPKYFMLSQDERGWINLELKNELCQEDMPYIDQEKINKLQ